MILFSRGHMGVVVEAETADAAREKAQRRGYFVLEPDSIVLKREGLGWE